MPTGLYVNPFPALELTVDGKEELYNTAQELVREACGMYEEFLWKQDGQLSEAKWSKVKQREKVAVYHDRRPGAGTENPDMHLLLTIGSVVGTLDDALYGVLNHTIEDMRIKSVYVGDSVVDSAVLETIVDPTPDNPFNSVSVRWFVQSVPRHVRLFSKSRSALYVEAMGKMMLSNDEVVGFRLLHSVSFPCAPPLPQYERSNISICMLMRQSDDEHVQTFVTSYVEIRESLMTSMIVRSVSEALLTPWKYIQVSQLKKLAWMIKHKAVFRHNEDRTSLLEDGCSVCGSHSRSTKKGSKSACAVCSKTTCSKCRIKRELLMFALDGSLLPHTTRVCVRCVTVANGLDAAKIAADDACRLHGGADSSYLRTMSEAVPTKIDPTARNYGLGPHSVSTTSSDSSSISM